MVVEKLSQYIAEKGFKQVVIAKAIGVSPQTMSETLAGRRTLSADEYRDICDFLEVPYGRFMES